MMVVLFLLMLPFPNRGAELNDFIGKWQFVSSENYQDYLKELDTANRNLTSTTWIENVFLHFLHKEHVLEFEFARETFTTTPDGRQMRSVFYFPDGNSILQHEFKRSSHDKESLITYRIADNQLIKTMESGSVRATRIFQKVQ
ncbi:hypothetical protein QR680_010068 [Steinernema hermaphroditum]|uniref:Lipocalin-like domain-containing protein n=1 Tax=Steinernema hermaphroditum TaxID=289476 RepID=A0AA39MAV5_9BILA|nr:hypothetical protein QR680_010068 [Steinernema hermaphroditum]